LPKKSEIGWEDLSQYESDQMSPGFLLWQVTTLWRRKISETLRPYDITHPQLVLLTSIVWNAQDSQVIQADLARHTKMDINQVSQVLKTLEKKNLIRRKESSKDPRAKELSLTTLGGDLLKQLIPAVEAIDHCFFKVLGTQQRTLCSLLRILKD